jgi:hypothetical protein
MTSSRRIRRRRKEQLMNHCLSYSRCGRMRKDDFWLKTPHFKISMWQKMESQMHQ